jgi:dUTP pyrophosphatase
MFKVKRLTNTAQLPTKGSDKAAGWDLYADIYDGTDKITIEPGKTALIGTGISVEIPDGTFLGIFARSGLSTNLGLGLANGVGVVDSDYRGEIKIPLHNHSDETRVVNHGDRIAQGIIIPYTTGLMTEVMTLNETERGENGFGSTGN